MLNVKENLLLSTDPVPSLVTDLGMSYLDCSRQYLVPWDES